jgi:hypothetical protein
MIVLAEEICQIGPFSKLHSLMPLDFRLEIWHTIENQHIRYVKSDDGEE